MRTVEVHRVTLAVLVAAFLIALTVLHLVPDKVSLDIGDVASADIRAPHAARYEDTVATQELRLQLLSTVTREYETDPYAVPIAESAVNRIFTRIEMARSQGTQPAALDRAQRLRDQISREFGPQLNIQGVRTALTVEKPVFDLLQATTRGYVLGAMRRPVGIREGTDDIQDARREIAMRAESLQVAGELRQLARDVAQYALRPTSTFSPKRTEQARKRMEALVKPMVGEILPNEPIVRKGDLITQTHIDKLTALGLRHPRLDWRSSLYVAILIIGGVALVGAYLRRYHPRIYAARRHLWLLAILVVGAMSAFKVGGTALGIKLDNAQYGYFGMLCVSTASMLIAVLLHPSLAMLIASVLSLHVGIMMNLDLRFAGVTLLSSLVGIHSFSRIRDRGDLVRSLLVLGVANTAAIWTLGGILGESVRDLLTGIAWGIGASVLACLVTWLGVALLERPFEITTHIGLLELSDMNQPALRRLLQDAPGTYIHSLNVGQLAEAAAEAIGADPLLARVAAYYHDIGKVMRPYCFVENQTVENIHNRLNPTLSTLVVTSHIKDGVDLGREYRLPPVVMEVIQSHHGTGLVKYFYHQAMLAREGDAPVPEQQFRYEGPRPRSKEAGIIMLADSVEGAVRAALADRPDPSRIQGIVMGIIRDKAADGQLDECELTFADLSKVAGAFARILQSIHHARIKYPDALTPEGQSLHAISSGTAAERPAGALDTEGGADDRRQLTAP